MTTPPHQVADVFTETEISDFSTLYQSIDKPNVHGLNLTVPEHARAVIKPWNEREDTTASAESQDDDEIIIHVPFIENVRVRSVLFKFARGEFSPRHLRIYANHPYIVDFTEAEDLRPHLDINLREGEAGVIEYPLRTAAFANVHSLSLFFNEAVGRESIRIYYIGFKGDSRVIKKEANSKLDIPAANAPDAKVIDRLQEKAAGAQATAR
ncbi:unnamed protein product [Somion occarium]|uniref:PITH domain-containing protein n=1 Tax=Somion occarium TaxID=3059160 RepID=A0ABP1D926_9APHY